VSGAAATDRDVATIVIDTDTDTDRRES